MMTGIVTPPQVDVPGSPELIIILLILALLFGADKIPELARSTGKAMGEFQKGREEVEQELSNQPEKHQQSQSGNSEKATPTSRDTSSATYSNQDDEETDQS